MRRNIMVSLVGVLLLLFAATAAFSAPYDEVLKRWQKTETFADAGERIEITATYYSAEFVEALVQSEADKNLWTQDEMEQYKYRLLSSLKLEETIPVRFHFTVRGSSLHLAPFGEQVSLRLGKKAHSPVEYDPRFNFKITDEREGLVHFPRYDEETGKDLLEGVSTVKLEVSGGISMAIRPMRVDFVWDVDRDDPSRFYAGEAGKRLEMDRLIKRLARLNEEKAEYEQMLEGVVTEIERIEARMDELNQ